MLLSKLTCIKLANDKFEFGKNELVKFCSSENWQLEQSTPSFTVSSQAELTSFVKNKPKTK